MFSIPLIDYEESSTVVNSPPQYANVNTIIEKIADPASPRRFNINHHNIPEKNHMLQSHSVLSDMTHRVSQLAHDLDDIESVAESHL